MKRFFYFVFGLVTVVGIAIGVGVVIWKAPPTVTAILTGGLGFIASKLYETYQENKRRNFEAKKEVYLKLIEPYKDLIINSIINKKVKAELDSKKLENAVHAAFDAILYGSDNVVRAFGNFRTLTSQESPNQAEGTAILISLATLMKEMRKDIGEWTTVNEVELLMMFINLTKTQKEDLIKLIKKA